MAPRARKSGLSGPRFIPAEQQRRKPDGGAELVQVPKLPSQKTSKAKNKGRQERGKRVQLHGRTSEEVGEQGSQEDVNDDGPGVGGGHAEQIEQPRQRVENRRLDVRQERHATKDARVPERQAALSNGLRGVGPVGVEVLQDVQATHGLSQKQQFPEEACDQCGQNDRDRRGAPQTDGGAADAGGWLAGFAG